jgi:hypothetical protein
VLFRVLIFCVILFTFQCTPKVKEDFYRKQGLEKVLRACYLNLHHLSFICCYRQFPFPVHRVDAKDPFYRGIPLFSFHKSTFSAQQRLRLPANFSSGLSLRLYLRVLWSVWYDIFLLFCQKAIGKLHYKDFSKQWTVRMI